MCASLPGPLQGPKGSESKRHAKVEPGSLAANPNEGLRSLVSPDGPEVIVVTGGTQSGTNSSAPMSRLPTPSQFPSIARG